MLVLVVYLYYYTALIHLIYRFHKNNLFDDPTEDFGVPEVDCSETPILRPTPSTSKFRWLLGSFSAGELILGNFHQFSMKLSVWTCNSWPLPMVAATKWFLIRGAPGAASGRSGLRRDLTTFGCRHVASWGPQLLNSAATLAGNTEPRLWQPWHRGGWQHRCCFGIRIREGNLWYLSAEDQVGWLNGGTGWNASSVAFCLSQVDAVHFSLYVNGFFFRHEGRPDLTWEPGDGAEKIKKRCGTSEGKVWQVMFFWF